MAFKPLVCTAILTWAHIATAASNGSSVTDYDVLQYVDQLIGSNNGGTYPVRQCGDRLTRV